MSPVAVPWRAVKFWALRFAPLVMGTRMQELLLPMSPLSPCWVALLGVQEGDREVSKPQGDPARGNAVEVAFAVQIIVSVEELVGNEG